MKETNKRVYDIGIKGGGGGQNDPQMGKRFLSEWEAISSGFHDQKNCLIPMKNFCNL